MFRNTMITLALATSILACGKKDEMPAPTPPPVAEVAVSDAAPAEAPPEVDPSAIPEMAAAGEVPTAEDFEAQAQADVTAENLEAEVKSLEAELLP